jgi:hypothetical protein
MDLFPLENLKTVIGRTVVDEQEVFVGDKITNPGDQFREVMGSIINRNQDQRWLGDDGHGSPGELGSESIHALIIQINGRSEPIRTADLSHPKRVR